MKTDRLNALTDGVIAIIITIMVLELAVPEEPGMAALKPVSVLFAAYALSFLKVGIYWSQHHNMLQAARRVDGRVLLANLFFLFWLSLVPFVVRWVGEAGLTRDTVIAFGAVMLLCTLSFTLLRSALLAANDPDAPIVRAAAHGWKGAITIASYVVAILAALWQPMIAVAIYVVVALMWLVPDKRFEQLAE
ncbi:MAG: TMEM175 family protein [Alphaproteobacteria bacterium]